MSVEITRLDNGIHVLSHAMPQLETVALGTWVQAGARDEHADQNGIAHLLEHMAFKGTSRRDALQIAEALACTMTAAAPKFLIILFPFKANRKMMNTTAANWAENMLFSLKAAALEAQNFSTIR